MISKIGSLIETIENDEKLIAYKTSLQRKNRRRYSNSRLKAFKRKANTERRRFRHSSQFKIQFIQR